jgi:hypothetical protein
MADEGQRFSGPALGSIAAGGLLVFAGIKGYSLTTALQDILKGTSPLTETQAKPITSTTETSPAGGTITSEGGQPSGSDAQNQALGKQMAAAAPYDWTGPEWTALNNIVMAESGWSDTVVNPTSTASGIAQNIAGWSSDYPEGDAQAQIAWLLSYIRQRYGTPIIAWAFHLANGWY